MKVVDTFASDLANLIEPDNEKHLRYGKDYAPVQYMPYVLNGPQDQRPFHNILVSLQEHDAPAGDIPWDVYRRRLSLISSTCIEPTSQFLLEGPKETAKSWSSNYGTHGWHRYVGRFPPHLVRALLNHFKAGPNDVVLDPFSGSGTTLVECRLLGIPGIGIEICPLSALLSRTKAKFPFSTKELVKVVRDLEGFYIGRWNEFLHGRDVTQVEHSDVIGRAGNMVEAFANYERWLTLEAILGISIVVEYAAALNGYLRDAVVLALSAKMRSIGNVDVDVVRAEYSKSPRENVDVLKLVKAQLMKMAKSIEESVKSHKEIVGDPDTIKVIEGDVLGAQIEAGSVSYVITSPPYGVEAISYLRTHLLSYRCLNTFLGVDPYTFGKNVIGSEYLADTVIDVSGFSVAEMSETYRMFFGELLPGNIEKKYRIRATMMMKFFEDIYQVTLRLQRWVRLGGKVAFVIGNNKIGNTLVPTDRIIHEIFEASGFRLERVLEHKLKSNNSNSQVPWQDRIIQDEFVMVFDRR